MGLFKRFSMQFMHPKGFWGHVAGILMGMTTGKRNEWTLSLLDIQPDDRVLEIGYGPGVGIQLVTKRLRDGVVVGIDVSETMRTQAERRNHEAIQQGKVQLLTANVMELPDFDYPFDKIFSINSAPFWPDRSNVFRELYQLLKPEGKMAITYQPLYKGATERDAITYMDRLIDELREIGFTQIRKELKVFKPVSAVCVIAQKPDLQ